MLKALEHKTTVCFAGWCALQATGVGVGELSRAIECKSSMRIAGDAPHKRCGFRTPVQLPGALEQLPGDLQAMQVRRVLTQQWLAREVQDVVANAVNHCKQCEGHSWSSNLG